MLTCPICSKSDISDARGLNVHLKKCRKKVSADIGPPNLNRPAKKQKKHHKQQSSHVHDEDTQILLEFDNPNLVNIHDFFKFELIT